MSFNFDELLQQGKTAAEIVEHNEMQIKEVLEDLENSLARFLDIPVALKEVTGYVKNHSTPLITAIEIIKKPREKTGYMEVHIESRQVTYSQEIFQLKRSDNIYPITIVRERHRSVADNLDEFVSEIQQIASNAQLHLQLKSFKRTVQELVSQSHE